MSSIHPAFDIDTATWFVGDLEAPSLRQLQKLLPPNTTIVGYYPNGYRVDIKYPNIQTRLLPTITYKPVQFVKPAAPRAHVTNQYEEILNLWAKGLSAREIGKRLHITRGVANGIVRRARMRNNPRAASRKMI